MISIIITAFREANTIGRAMAAFTSQRLPAYELLVVAPDEETAAVVRQYANKRIRYIKDQGKGKPTALNLTLRQAKGDILILSDGDVTIGKGAVAALLKPFTDSRVGAVSSRPISINDKGTMLGYWSHLLTDAGAHWRRMRGNFVECSGYLYAIRNVIREVPEDALADDAYISHLIAEQGYTIAYAPAAKVYVKYPSTFSDWLLQKRRSAGGTLQIRRRFGKGMRGFRKESRGIFSALSYARNVRECGYTIMLIFARICLWLLIQHDQRIARKGFSIWKRVESTK
ncbi:MAG TPA: glycosyltransferase [Candidatus Nanoarchaeia archaeon]|nr:glycosyltransferase [Candidatus Nanoarchaeia archaeon]